jgi:hypothetical protein
VAEHAILRAKFGRLAEERRTSIRTDRRQQKSCKDQNNDCAFEDAFVHLMFPPLSGYWCFFYSSRQAPTIS